jgi:nickel transport protein
LTAASALFLLLTAAPSLHAHKVNLFAWVEGNTIHTESYFPDGKAVQNGDISVLDSQGTLLLRGVTDSEGMFSFPVPKRDELTVVLEASMGHRAAYTLTARELGPGPPDLRDAAREQVPGDSSAETAQTSQPSSEEVGAAVTTEELRAIVREEISRELDPLSAKLSRLHENDGVTVHDVFAGIGYILGLFGLALFFKSRTKR